MTELQLVLEDYRRRLTTISAEIEKLGDIALINPDDATYVRYTTKASCYRTVIAELEKITPPVCVDSNKNEIVEFDLVDVQNAGIFKVFQQEDGKLFFHPYNKKEFVHEYFSNDITKVDLKDGKVIQYKDGFGYWYEFTPDLKNSKTFVPFKLRIKPE